MEYITQIRLMNNKFYKMQNLLIFILMKNWGIILYYILYILNHILNHLLKYILKYILII